MPQLLNSRKPRYFLKYLVLAVAISIAIETATMLSIRQLLVNGDDFFRAFNLLRFLMTVSAVYLILTYGLRVVHAVMEGVRRFFAQHMFRTLCMLLLADIFLCAVYFVVNRMFLFIDLDEQYGCLVCLLVALDAVILYKLKYIARFENLFIICGVAILFAYLLCVPSMPYAGDSRVHYTRVYENALVDAPITVYSGEFSTTGQTYSSIQNALSESSGYQYTGEVFNVIMPKEVPYLPYIAGLFFSLLFHAGAAARYCCSLGANIILILLIYYFSMRRLKSGKLLVAIFALLPGHLRILGMCSYSSWGIALITMGCCYIIGLLQEPDRRVELRDTLKIYLIFFIATLAKGPYFPVCLLIFLLPKRRFTDSATYWKTIVCVFLTMAAILFAMFIPTMLDERGFEVFSDKRGGELVSASGQIRYILHEPIQYGKTMLRFLFRSFDPNVFVLGQSGFGIIFYYTQACYPAFSAFFLLAAIILDNNGSVAAVFSVRNRVIAFAVAAVLSVIIVTTMYMNYSEVGSSVIRGVNPLYLLAFMFPTFYFMGGCAVPRCSERNLYAALLGGYCVYLFASYFCVILPLYV